MELTGKNIMVVGMGKSGVSAARFLISKGANVTITDMKSMEELSETMRDLHDLPVEYELGEHSIASFLRSYMIVTSPGVPLDIPPILAAKNLGIPVVSEMELAVIYLNIPVIAITGTNGKTTTTTLIAELLKAGGKKVFLGGNIGTPLIDIFNEKMSYDWVVLEVSSFQLDTTPSLHPHIALLLNITPDHLDRYVDFDAYTASKMQIFSNMGTGDVAIVNSGDNVINDNLPQLDARVLTFGHGEQKGRNSWQADNDLKIEFDDFNFSIPVSKAGSSQRIHFKENIMAAVLAALSAGISEKVIKKTLKGFRGLHHRLEIIRMLKGVKYYNDSKATNVGATIKALENFNEDVVLIAGGRDKGCAYDALYPVVKKKVTNLILIGEAASKIKAVMNGSQIMHHVNTMDEAVETASSLARPGQVVLLSPACSSFDMYSNYQERGHDFIRCVNELR